MFCFDPLLPEYQTDHPAGKDQNENLLVQVWMFQDGLKADGYYTRAIGTQS